MKIKIYHILLTGLVSIFTVSCNKYLDVMPDNRAELDTETKISKILVSAYATNPYLMSAEFSSDNVDDYGVNNPNSERIVDQLFNWIDVTEVDGNEGPKEVWEGYYKAIASANKALEAIEEAGNPSSLNPQKGEALLARAYGHFVLVNLFSQHYTKANSNADLGITYMFKPENTLDPKYERNTVADVYKFIKADIEAGLPLINDAKYSAPKFHFNRAAANAFAARVYLYTQDWDKAIRYATSSIGANPTSLLRDNAGLALKPVQGVADMSKFYVASTIKANLMLATGSSNMGLYFGNYSFGSRFSHGRVIADTETFLSDTPWGNIGSSGYVLRAYVYSGTNLDKVLLPRVSYMFETTDPVAGIGFRRTVYAPFTTEETLLVRAEAYIHLKQYSNAVTDMKLWLKNNVKTPPANFGETSINDWATSLEYFTPSTPTPKKKLNPEFAIESGTQENMLQCLLFMRRLETIHTGLRWFDVKRYGIEIERRVISSGAIGSINTSGKLVARDKRSALQLPPDVIGAGMTPNPR